MSDTTADRRSSPPGWMFPALLVAAVAVAFWPALGADFVDWDDSYLLTGNFQYRGLDGPHLRWMLTTFHMGHWQPLTWLTYALDHAVWGMSAPGYHLTSVALHAANAVLVYLLARRLFVLAGAAAVNPDGAALLAALLFAVHPLRVESVAWVTERRDVLSGFFLLLAVLAWVGALETEPPRPVWYAASLACLALSLLAKAWGMTLPAVLLVLDFWPLRRLGGADGWRVPLGRLLREKVPFIALAAAVGVVAYLAQREAGAMSLGLRPSQRAAQAAYGLTFYIQKSIVPTGLSPAYLLETTLDPLDARYVLAALGVLGVAGLLVAFRRRSPAVVAGFVCYAILVSPVLGLAQSGIQLVADRYSYLSCVPLALLVGGAFGRVSPASGAGRMLAAAAAAAVLLLGVGTWRQSLVWRDSLALWNHALAVDPDSWLAHNNRGTWYKDQGDPERAIAEYDAAIRLKPDYAVAYNNRGNAHIGQGDVAGAIDDWNRALTVHPGFFDALLNRGSGRLMQGDTEGAAADLEAAVSQRPASALGWYNLASAHAALGDFDRAAADCRRALEIADDQLRERVERKLAAIVEEQARRQPPQATLP